MIIIPGDPYNNWITEIANFWFFNTFLSHLLHWDAQVLLQFLWTMDDLQLLCSNSFALGRASENNLVILLFFIYLCTRWCAKPTQSGLVLIYWSRTKQKKKIDSWNVKKCIVNIWELHRPQTDLSGNSVRGIQSSAVCHQSHHIEIVNPEIW